MREPWSYYMDDVLSGEGVFDDPEPETECPDCKGRCYDGHGLPCKGCHGEGVVDNY